jgi:hypothetical protein
MLFTIEFIRNFAIGLFYASPLVLTLLLLIALLGLIIGKREGWTRINSLYYAFITATTVGYGDFRPNTTPSKILAICIAFTGLLLTGIVVAIGLEAAAIAFKAIHTEPILNK